MDTALFPDVFTRQAAQTPDVVAVEYGDEKLTYAELALAARRLAGELTGRGVRPGELVGITARPSLELVVGILGIVGARAAWLPLDPGYPADRLRYMLADSGVTRLVADERTGRAIGGDLIEIVDPHASADPAPLARHEPDDLAYVIYTSGSTGRPKGVQLTHRGLANLTAAEAGLFGAGPGKRVLQFAPISFDASVFEIAMALGTGATLVLAPREDIGPGPGLGDFLRDKHITHVTLPPSVLATVPGGDLPELEVLICAGEALPEPLVRRWQPGRRMFNAYGPTETTVWATIAELDGPGKPSIGAAISGATTVVIDENLRPVEPGVPGELAVGGAGLARGYLGRPELTAERFVTVLGERHYRTGDRVVENHGSLEFLGRIDDQVKVRGFRIEPGEITAQLRAHDGVADAAVVVRDDGAGDELVAYVTGGATPDELSAFLATVLPKHMVPSAIVVLQEMPLSPSGKIDRAALPAPVRGGSEHVAPRTPTERALADILAELLGVAEIGVTDDFFALGGHSLLAGRFAARVRSVLGRELPLVEFYERRTVAATAELLDATTPDVVFAPITASDEDGPVPLSFPQERIWFLERLAPGNLAYNAQATIRLQGPLDADVLRDTLTEIVRRHEVFRTAFVPVDGEAVQLVREPMDVELPLVDLSGTGNPEERAEDVVRETVADPFDLSAPPLVRWVLIRLAADDHMLVHVEHHLVHDGWSYALFLHELQALYPALVAGEPSPLEPIPVQYKDFARWQRDWLQGDVLETCLAHWRTELAGAPAALELPTDRPRPASQSFAGAAVNLDLPGDLCRRLRAYSHEHGTTLYTTMLAGFAALLSRYSGQDDVVLGSGVANRRQVEIEPMIGMVVNTLPLRVRLDGSPSFGELVRRAHETIGRAHQWQDVPIDRLVGTLPIAHDPSRNPVFQAMFSFHDSLVPDLRFAGLSGSVRERHNGSAKTDLNVVVIPRAEQQAGHGVGDAEAPISLIWEYATDLFDERTMRAMVGHFEALLSAALDAPELPFARLPMLTETQACQRIEATVGSTPDFPGAGLAELFAEQAAARPDAVALVSDEETLTYAELADRSGRLARVLRDAGVRAEVPVGVLLERGTELLTVLLAVVKAGGAYVPLDPAYPADRIGWMLADADVPLVVTRSGLRELAGDTPVVALDEIELAEPLDDAGATGANLAYVMFTSGSTGRPKGVQVPQRAVVRLVRGADYVHFGPENRFAQVADPSFDALTFELWGALLNGGSTALIPPDALLTPGELGRRLKRHGVTTMFLTSALFTEVMAEHPDSFAGMTDLMVGGDALNVARVRKLLEQKEKPARLVNGYGPTEVTTFAVCHHIEDVPERAPSIPIGTAIANTTAYVLDEFLRPTPEGVPGELYLGGPGVARGYANRPALTAERFLPDPFAADGSRMYRTGDRVRTLPDGTIEFLGRFDDQVKIRGFRIEPGEVEAALAAHPALAQVAVVARGESSDKRLVAYVVAKPGQNATGLREFLAATLPPHLVPAVFAELPEMPMTTSGKVDRKRLPEVGEVRPDAGEYVAPRGETETAVAELVAQNLGLERVGVTDDFFALGGHSLLAMRLVARVNERWECDVALREFLRTPTVAVLAAAVDAGRGSAQVITAAHEEELLLDRLDELSDEEVEALLRTTENEVDR